MLANLGGIGRLGRGNWADAWQTWAIREYLKAATSGQPGRYGLILAPKLVQFWPTCGKFRVVRAEFGASGGGGEYLKASHQWPTWAVRADFGAQIGPLLATMRGISGHSGWYGQNLVHQRKGGVSYFGQPGRYRLIWVWELGQLLANLGGTGRICT